MVLLMIIRSYADCSFPTPWIVCKPGSTITSNSVKRTFTATKAANTLAVRSSTKLSSSVEIAATSGTYGEM